MGVDPNTNIYMYKECPPLILIGPYLYWQERGWAWSHITRHEENMEKKSAKNCTLYHVVNKAVWADIGAASTSSTNRQRHTDILQHKIFRGFFKCLQSQYIGANRFAAPIYWRSTRRTKLFAAPRLFGQTMPIQSAEVSGSGNRIIPRWRPN